MFNAFFATVLNTDDRPMGSQCPELEDHESNNDQLSADPENVQDLLLQMDPCKPIGPRILKELFYVIAKTLSMTFEQSWKSGEVPADRELLSV